ncbi:MAG: glycosyltransferase [Alphaproteobacteria bacterium]|nr:glycosyltransferase [Alphaproteobacteria bacterium]
MRILTITTLFPNAAAPNHGVFVESRLADLRARHDVDLRVIAPVPWFPFDHAAFGKYAEFARAPAQEVRRGVTVRHPRYAIPPKIGMTYAAFSLERRLRRAIAEVCADGWDFDLIDAHYLYPDGVAATRVAADIGKPIILTARGSDVSEIPAHPLQRRMILSSVALADCVVCVADALREELISIGAPAEKLRTLRNGVDLDRFRPVDGSTVRKRFGLSGDLIVSVGHLIPRKGHDLVIDAVAALAHRGADVSLLIIGDGPERQPLEAKARQANLADRVRFAGAVPNEELSEYYSAADVLALGSTREGWPNVLLEAMACGVPAVAPPVWGCAEVIAAPEAGRIAAERSAPALAEALSDILTNEPDRAATRAYAERFSWEETSDALFDIFSTAIARADLASRTAISPTATPLPAIAAQRPQPRLLITVDTEEIFDWLTFEPDAFRIADPADLNPFQALCADRGARPLYFLSYPIIEDARSVAYFSELRQRNAADLGLHLHQWVTPRDHSYKSEFHSWQMNLPDEVHREKLEVMASAFEAAFGARATAHRAGRYGIAPHCYPALADIGVTHDFSPSPAFDKSDKGGPDFSAMSNRPFALTIDGERTMWVTPVSGAHGRRGGAIFAGAAGPAGFQRRRIGAKPLLSSALRLSPEGPNLAEMIALARHLIANDISILTFSIHSTSFTPGANQYAARQSDIDATLEKTDAFLAAFAADFGGAFIGLDELARIYRDAERPDASAGVAVNRPLSVQG